MGVTEAPPGRIIAQAADLCIGWGDYEDGFEELFGTRTKQRTVPRSRNCIRLEVGASNAYAYARNPQLERQGEDIATGMAPPEVQPVFAVSVAVLTNDDHGQPQ